MFTALAIAAAFVAGFIVGTLVYRKHVVVLEKALADARAIATFATVEAKKL